MRQTPLASPCHDPGQETTREERRRPPCQRAAAENTGGEPSFARGVFKREGVAQREDMNWCS